MDNPVDSGDNMVGAGDGARGGDSVPIPTHPAGEPEPPGGVDLARRALQDARAAAKARGKAVGRGGVPSRSGVRRAAGGRRRWSGPGADDRDPQTLATAAAGLVRSRGWSQEIAAGAVLGRWNALVGADIAAHAQPEALVDGELLVRAESTAWATQLRMMQRQLLAAIAGSVGNGIVTRLTVRGPTAPSWKRGERRVRGRGPRDTYG